MVIRSKDESKRLGVLKKDNNGYFRELTFTALMVLYAFFNDELILIVIHGRQGYGKSTLASIAQSQVYGAYDRIKEVVGEQYPGFDEFTVKRQRKVYIQTLNELINSDEMFTYNWKKTKDMFVFKPEDFINKTVSVKKKVPCCVVDDAGMWLNSMDYQNPFVKAVGRFFEVARTKYGAIIFTCSDLKQVFSKLRNMPHVYTIRVIKEGHGESRIGIIHEGWESEDLKKSGRTKLLFDGFIAEMYDPFYRWYQPIRVGLANEGTELMWKEFEKLMNK